MAVDWAAYSEIELVAQSVVESADWSVAVMERRKDQQLAAPTVAYSVASLADMLAAMSAASTGLVTAAQLAATWDAPLAASTVGTTDKRMVYCKAAALVTFALGRLVGEPVG